MNTSKKHSKRSIDFLSTSANRQKTGSSKTKFFDFFSFKSFKGKFSIKSIRKFSYNSSKNVKKAVYKKFFWGRGLSYKYSVLLAIIAVILPVSFITNNVKVSAQITKAESTQFSDTAYDTGGGKTSLPNSRTIESVVTYTVQNGDSISSIAAKFDNTTDSLAYTNNLDPNNPLLRVGQTLKIPPFSGIIYKAQAGDTLDSIAAKFHIAENGYSSQIILEANLMDDPNDVPVGKEFFVPGAKIDRPAVTTPPLIATTKKPTIASTNVNIAAPSAVNVPAGVNYFSPMAGAGQISQCFKSSKSGISHDGVDIAAPIGTPLYAMADGRVVYAGWRGGITIEIDHGNGIRLIIYHMSKVVGVEGRTVKKGDLIGYVGNTGRSTGPHAHISIVADGAYRDPMLYITSLKDKSQYFRQNGVNC